MPGRHDQLGERADRSFSGFGMDREQLEYGNTAPRNASAYSRESGSNRPVGSYLSLRLSWSG